MQFRLLYEGPIGPRQRINAEDIHRIRMALHPKLKALWQYKPLSDFAHQLRETTRPEEVAIYVPTNHVCMDYEPFRVSYTAGQPYVAATLSMYPPPGESNMGNFIAWDGKTGTIVWSVPTQMSVWGGAPATSGGVVSYRKSRGDV